MTWFDLEAMDGRGWAGGVGREEHLSILYQQVAVDVPLFARHA